MTDQGDVSRFPTTLGGIFETLFGFTSTLEDENIRHYFVSNFPGELAHDAGFFVGINCFFRIQYFAQCANRYETAHNPRKTTCADGEKTIFRSKYMGYVD